MNVARRLPVLLALALCCTSLLVVSACGGGGGGGGGIPDDAVVKIGGDTITKVEFDHWLAGLVKKQGPNWVVPRPPAFSACIDRLKATAQPAEGRKLPTDAQLKSRCQQEYDWFRVKVVRFLVSSAWTEGEAYDEGVRVPDSRVAKDLDQEVQPGLPSGPFNREDQLYYQRVQELSAGLNKKLAAKAAKLSSADIAKYYNAHRKQFSMPERRDLQIVVTKTKTDGQRARKQVSGGSSFQGVAKELAPDFNGNGRVLQNLVKKSLGKSLGNVVFGAKQGPLVGPVKTPVGYLVFRVVKITPPGVQPLADVKAQIRQTLTAQREQALTFGYQRKWRARTECRQGYVIELCKDGHRPAMPVTVPGQTISG